MKSNIGVVVCVSLAVVGGALGSSERVLAAADTADANSSQGLAEIVVTAQRREQRLQDVGVSVTAITSDELRQMGIKDSKDISKAVPGVLLDSVAGGDVNANLTIRGVSQSDFSAIQESPNSMYVDDVYLSSPNSAAFPLYDLQRVEVLRGPQGTLFGRASSGGLANFISEKPTREWSGYAEAGYSSFNDRYGEAAVGGPLSDRVRFRVSGRFEKADGWWQNGLPGGQATFNKNFFGIRMQLEADLTDKLNARLSVSWDQDPRHNEGTYRSIPDYIDANGKPALLPPNLDFYGTCPGCDAAGYLNPYSQFNKSDFNNVGFLVNRKFSPTLYVTYDLGNAKLTSITNYTNFNYHYGEDCDGGPVNLCADELAQTLKQYSQEFRLNGTTGDLTYTTGLYYLNIDTETPQSFSFPAFSGTGFAFGSFNNVHQKVQTYAPFGQLEYKIAPTLTATFGARYTRERKTFDSKAYFSELGSDFGGTGVNNPPLLVYDFSEAAVGDLAVHSEGLWSGKVGLDYKPNRDTLLYLSASRGVKAAGFNTNLAANLSVEATPFKSEWVNAFEAGSKLEFLDRKLRLNSSVYYYKYHRFQGYAYTIESARVSNYEGYFTGGEVELTAAPTKDLDVNLAVAYLQSKLHDITSTYGGVYDERGVNAPKWTMNGAVTKRFALPIGTLSLSWDGNYIGDKYASIDNNVASFVPSSFVHNARITLNLKDQGLDLSVFVNNISNRARENFVTDGTGISGSLQAAYAQPRWIGGSIRKNF